MNILILNFKKTIISILCLVFIICLLLFSNSNIEAARDSLYLWAYSVIPSLFPFFIATELLYCTNLISFLEKRCNKFMKKFFNLSGEATFPIIMGFISGYPTGAKIINELRIDKKISKTEGEHLLAFTNNSGPLFIIGTVGTSLFCNRKIGLLLLITHILGALSVGFIFKFWKPTRKSLFIKKQVNSKTPVNISTILVNSVSKSVITILNIGGFIVLFSVIISILENLGIFNILANFLSNFGISEKNSIGLFSGLLELTNGLKNLSIIGTKNINEIIILSSFLLGFGGLSVAMQVYSCISKSDLSIKPYLIGKLLHGLLSAFYTFILIMK